MLRPMLTLRVFAGYLLALGLGFAVAPRLVLPWFGFPPPQDYWVRVLGGILLILSYYYLAAARASDLPFARRSVWGRLPLVLFYWALAAFAGAPWVLVAVGVFESGCGVWTWVALRRHATSG